MNLSLPYPRIRPPPYHACMRVLIVEDDPLLANGLTETLRREGFVADAVASGAAADAALRVAEIDLVILDIGLPRMDGFTWLKRLRARGRAGGAHPHRARRGDRPRARPHARRRRLSRQALRDGGAGGAGAGPRA